MKRTQSERIADYVKSYPKTNFSRGVIFHDPASARVSSPFPFVAVIPTNPITTTFRSRENLLEALADINLGANPFDIMTFMGGKDNSYLGFSGKCEADFREELEAYRTGFFQLPVDNLSTGPFHNARYISCLTLRDCVEAVSARLNEPVAVDYDLMP